MAQVLTDGKNGLMGIYNITKQFEWHYYWDYQKWYSD